MRLWIKTRIADGVVTIHRDPPRLFTPTDYMHDYFDAYGRLTTEVKSHNGVTRSLWVEGDVHD